MVAVAVGMAAAVAATAVAAVVVATGASDAATNSALVSFDSKSGHHRDRFFAGGCFFARLRRYQRRPI
jgi:hypothetical protein